MDPQWQYNHLVIPLGISVILILALIAQGFWHRRNPLAKPYLAFMLCVLIWMTMSLLEIITLNFRLSLFIADISFLGITFFSVTWLGIVLIYIGKEKLFRRLVPWLIIIPTLTNIIIWTNALHHLWRGEATRDLTTTWFPITDYDYGLWFYAIHLPYGLGISFLSTFLLLRALFSFEKAYRGQIIILLIAFNLPLFMEILLRIGFSPIPHFNMSTLVFPVSGLLMGWSLLGFRFLDLMPIARDLVLDNMQDLMIVLDNQGRVTDLNPASRQHLFTDNDVVIGQRLIDLLPEQTELITRLTTQDQFRAELEIAHHEANHIYDVLISPINRFTGRKVGVLLLLRDITLRKQVEAEREQLIEDLDAYAHSVAHDLKNPLSISLGFASLLQDEMDETVPQSHKELTDHILHINWKMAEIVNSLLMLASVRQLSEIQTYPLQMGDIVEEALLRLALVIEETQAEITIPPKDRWPLSLGYAPWIEEVWANYISNALKYGGTPPHIEVGATSQDDGMVKFWVKDNGRGLTREEQGRLFIQFTRLDESRAEGHGLGLSIAKRIVEKLGGEVGVTSTLDEGSVFSFTLPASAQTEYVITK